MAYQNTPRTPASEGGGASYRVTQKRPAGVEETAPVMANARTVTNKRAVAPRNLMFNKEHGHDGAAYQNSPRTALTEALHPR